MLTILKMLIRNDDVIHDGLNRDTFWKLKQNNKLMIWPCVLCYSRRFKPRYVLKNVTKKGGKQFQGVFRESGSACITACDRRGVRAVFPPKRVMVGERQRGKADRVFLTFTTAIVNHMNLVKYFFLPRGVWSGDPLIDVEVLIATILFAFERLHCGIKRWYILL